MNRRDVFSEYVDEEYVEMIDEEALDYAWEYSERGGNPDVCVALGLSETDNLGMNLEEISEELDVSRRAVYDARDEFGLVENEARGRHVE